MEIEAKFRIDDSAVFATVTALKTLGPYQLWVAPHADQQHNTYYDTPSRRLEQAHYGLRTREVPGKPCLMTLKGPNQAHDGVHARAEWEFAASDPDPATWPDDEARAQVQALRGEEALRPILTIRTERQHVVAMRENQDVAEICLDAGTIAAAGRTQDFRELEIELLPAGQRDDLDALIAALREHIALVPEQASKLERGLALLHDAQ